MLIVSQSIAQTKLLRFPDIHGDEVVFCYAGDLWKAGTSGGNAIRLTAHPGLEVFPKFSPDGNWIAFTGQYDGDEQVYVIPSIGGTPKQLTYYPARGPLAPRWGYDNQIYGWTPDGSGVLFRSLRDANGGSTETALYTVSIEGGLPVKLPMPTSGAGDLNPDGTKIVYSPLFRDFRSWKRYEGGWAQNLYIFDLTTWETQEVSHSRRTERDPMWIGNTIYFASDRSGTLNLYSYNTNTQSVNQITDSDSWDVRWPSSDNKSQIIYEYAGELKIFNTENQTDKSLSIFVPDDGLSVRPSRYSAERNVEDFSLSPKGERALFVARGDVFTAPIEEGPTRNLTNSSDAHDKSARWSPDGRQIAFISDQSGEDQVYLIDQLGEGKPQQLTTEFKGMLYRPAWSPDGKRIAISDKDGKLYIITIDTGSVIEIADDEFGSISDYAWSPHGGHLAFSMSDWNGFFSLYIWSVIDSQTRRVTDYLFSEHHPSWDPEGNYLFYLSERDFAPQISNIEWNYAGNLNTGIYAVSLRKDVKNLFEPKSDEVEIQKEEPGEIEEKKNSKKDKKEDEKETPAYILIDFDGLADRVIKIPVKSDNIQALVATQDQLLYATTGARFYGRPSYAEPTLHIFSIKDRESSILAEDIRGLAISYDGTKVLIRQNQSYYIMETKPKTNDKKAVSTKGLMVDRIPKAEWKTVFWEVWRRFRDFFYVRNMHGYDWEAIGNQYSQLLEYVAHRSDLNYVISEMISELNIGHAYIQGGDYEIPERPSVALPGARFELDQTTGKYQILKIFKGDNEEEKYRSPLTEVGVDVQEGDYVIAINGISLDAEDNPYQLLQHKTDPVTLTINKQPTLSGSKDVKYIPIFSEQNLLYKEWIDTNREKVDKLTNSRVGYIHLPDMGSSGIYEFIKWFYPQIRKEGMVIDVRSNGGGNVSQWIIERLDSRMMGTRFGYDSDKPMTYPYTVFHGHKVCLLNETSASDGDIFPHYFRKAGLGPLIGKRTWGGVVGISGRGPLLDGGQVFVPMRATNDVNGQYIIEGKGVDPDIDVQNDPEAVLNGADPQLERGVEEVMKMIEENPLRYPDRPPDPVKTK